MYSVLYTDLEPVFVIWEMNTAQRSDSLLQLSIGSLFLFTPDRGNQGPKKGFLQIHLGGPLCLWGYLQDCGGGAAFRVLGDSGSHITQNLPLHEQVLMNAVWRGWSPLCSSSCLQLSPASGEEPWVSFLRDISLQVFCRPECFNPEEVSLCSVH